MTVTDDPDTPTAYAEALQSALTAATQEQLRKLAWPRHGEPFYPARKEWRQRGYS